MAYTKNNPYQQYRQAEVESLSQGELILMLYDGAIRFLREAIDLSGDFRNYEKVNANLLRVQDIITELMVSLDMDKGGEISQNLLSIYVYVKRKLIEANMKKDKADMDEALKHLQSLRSAWDEIIKKGVERPTGTEADTKRASTDEGGGISFTG